MNIVIDTFNKKNQWYVIYYDNVSCQLDVKIVF